VHPPAATRSAPPWLRDESFTDHPLGTLKTGKEAEIFLVERRYGGGTSVILAHKRYRPRRPVKGELREKGFTRATQFRHASTYHAGWFFSSRDRRAVETHTAHGREVIETMWPIQEHAVLRRAWDAGASVPYPVERTGDGVLMEFIGDATRAAPRLAQAGLGRSELPDAWAQLVTSLRALTGAGLVHADLSAYNVLWWQGRVVLIDLPQAVEFTTNADAPELLHRDLASVGTWFGRRGLMVDVEGTYAELLSLAW
jgi:RIO kinase 1